MSRLALVLALLLLPTAALAEEPSPLTLCLAPAADDSPCYPLKEVPATNREVIVVFRLRAGEAFKSLTAVWTAVEVGDAAPANTEIARGELALNGATSGHFKYSLPQDFPVGTYRLDVLADGKPWASLDFAVAAASEAAPLAKPADLLPLEPGTSWTYSWTLEAGPTVKNVTVAGATKGDDGRFRTTTTISVAGKEGDLAHVQMGRGGTPVSDEWWSLTEAGLLVTRQKVGDEVVDYDPPLPMIALPLHSPSAWLHQPKGGDAIPYRMWGPLPVRTPSGDKPGWIVWMRIADGEAATTVERQFVPGGGVVREVHVSARNGKLLTRVETALAPAK